MHQGCQTSSKTYIWQDTAGDCRLHRVRMIAPNRTQSTWLVDHQNQLLLNVTGTYSVPGCELVLQTIFLADLATSDTRARVYKMPQIAIREIDMQWNTAVALKYVAYQLSRQIEAPTQMAGSRVCKQQH